MHGPRVLRNACSQQPRDLHDSLRQHPSLTCLLVNGSRREFAHVPAPHNTYAAYIYIFTYIFTYIYIFIFIFIFTYKFYMTTFESIARSRYNWNMVMLAYCDGGSFSGDRETPLVTDSGATLHFRGAAILRAVQETLLGPAYGLAEASDVVISGCSAGGLATYMQCDRCAERLAQHGSPKVRCLSDSGLFLDVQDDFAASDAAAFENPGACAAYHPDSRSVVAVQSRSTGSLRGGAISGFHAALVWAYQAMELEGDASCMARYAPTNDQWRCAFAQYTLPEISTPTFVVNSKFDAWSLLASGVDSGSSTGGILTELDPSVINDGWASWFDEAVRQGLEANPGHAAFM